MPADPPIIIMRMELPYLLRADTAKLPTNIPVAFRDTITLYPVSGRECPRVDALSLAILTTTSSSSSSLSFRRSRSFSDPLRGEEECASRRERQKSSRSSVARNTVQFRGESAIRCDPFSVSRTAASLDEYYRSADCPDLITLSGSSADAEQNHARNPSRLAVTSLRTPMIST